MFQQSKIMVGSSIIKIVIVLGVLMFTIPSGGYTEGESNIYGGMANSFEEALEKNTILRESYEGASAEQQQQMQEHWQAKREKWKGRYGYYEIKDNNIAEGLPKTGFRNKLMQNK